MERVREVTVQQHVMHERIIQRHEIVDVQHVKMDIIVNDEQVIVCVHDCEVIIRIQITEEKHQQRVIFHVQQDHM